MAKNATPRMDAWTMSFIIVKASLAIKLQPCRAAHRRHTASATAPHGGWLGARRMGNSVGVSTAPRRSERLGPAGFFPRDASGFGDVPGPF